MWKEINGPRVMEYETQRRMEKPVQRERAAYGRRGTLGDRQQRGHPRGTVPPGGERLLLDPQGSLRRMRMRHLGVMVAEGMVVRGVALAGGEEREAQGVGRAEGQGPEE